MGGGRHLEEASLVQLAGYLVHPARRHLEGAENQLGAAHQREEQRRQSGLHAAEPRARRAGADQVEERADCPQREERVADEQHGDVDEDPVALQRGNERLDLLVGDEGGLAHGDEGQRHREDADDPESPFPLDDEVADHHRPGDEVQGVEEVGVRGMRDHVPEPFGPAEHVSCPLAEEDLDASGGDPARDEVGRVRADGGHGEPRGHAIELQLPHREARGISEEGKRVSGDGHDS